VSANPVSQSRPAETVSGLLASLSIFFSLIGVAYRPARLIPAALLLALLAVAMGGRHNRLGAIAAGVGALCFAVGMAVAVITGNPIY
jgi:hypothetical protein